MCSAAAHSRSFLFKKEINKYLDLKFSKDPSETIVRLIDKSVNVNFSHIKHNFIQITEFDKLKSLDKVLEERWPHVLGGKDQLVVFCNSVTCSGRIRFHLEARGLKTSLINGALTQRKRREEFYKFKNKKSNVLITTDLMARGIHFEGLKYVLNFDFPTSLSDYLHRAGRTGRNGTHGEVVSFYRKYNYELIDMIKKAHERQLPLMLNKSVFALKNKELMKKVMVGKELDMGSSAVIKKQVKIENIYKEEKKKLLKTREEMTKRRTRVNRMKRKDADFLKRKVLRYNSKKK